MTNSYRDEPPFNSAQDYYNEVYGLLCGIDLYLTRKELGSIFDLNTGDQLDVTNEAFCEAIAVARQLKQVLTIRERFLSTENGKFWLSGAEEINNAPLRVGRLDELAIILNTTEDLSEFIAAVNESYKVIYNTEKNIFPLNYLPHDLARHIPRVASQSMPSAPVAR